MNYTNLVTVGATYVSTSLGGSQARAACTVDDVKYLIDDKGGLFEGNGFVPEANIDPYNNVVVKSFGRTPHVETQKTANGSPLPAVYALGYDDLDGLYDNLVPNNLGTDTQCVGFLFDFHKLRRHLRHLVHGSDQDSSSEGVVNKYSWVNGANQGTGGYGWAANGSFTNSTGVDGLLVATNGNGGDYIFYTTGGGGTAGNTIIRLTDSAGWNQPISIISSNLIYTAAKTNSIKGLAFVPQQAPYTNQLIPPPILTAQTGANVASPFVSTNTPDDPEWRSAITLITVNGTQSLSRRLQHDPGRHRDV